MLEPPKPPFGSPFLTPFSPAARFLKKHNGPRFAFSWRFQKVSISTGSSSLQLELSGGQLQVSPTRNGAVGDFALLPRDQVRVIRGDFQRALPVSLFVEIMPSLGGDLRKPVHSRVECVDDRPCAGFGRRRDDRPCADFICSRNIPRRGKFAPVLISARLRVQDDIASRVACGPPRG